MSTRTKAFLAGSITAMVMMAAVPASIAALRAASPARCARNQLTIRSNGWQGAAGTIYGAWVFTNVSHTTCTLAGYPSLQLYGKGGRPVPTTVEQDLSPGATAVTLSPGGSATFRTSYSDVAGGRCPVSSVMQIMPPGIGKSLFIPATLTPCGGVVHVSAVRAGIHHA